MEYRPTLIEDVAFKSERLVYRAIDADRDAPLRNHFSNMPQIASLLNVSTVAPTDLHATRSSMVPSGSVAALVICLPDVHDGNLPGQAIGFIKLFGLIPGAPHRNATFSLSLDQAYQGQGYGAEALNYLCKIGFMYAGLHRIRGTYSTLNKGAAKCYEKVGFKVEGLEREALWYNGGWVDLVCIGILEHEWRALNSA